MVENAVSSVSGVKETKVAVDWEPPWDHKPYVGRGATRVEYVVS
jgi:metal-sulfur cluster biosynthetic enzyme